MKKLTKKLITAQLCMFIAGMQIFAEDRGAEFSIPSGFEASGSPVEQQRSDAFRLFESLIELVDRTFGEQGSLLDQIRRLENRESSAALSSELFDLQKRTAKTAFELNRGLKLIEAFSGVYGLSPAERSELQSIKNAIKLLQDEVKQNLELQGRSVRSLQEIKARTSQLPMADLLRKTPVPVELESMAYEVHRAEEVLKPLQKGLFDTYELLVDSARELQGFLSRHAAKLPIEVRIKPELPVLSLLGRDSDPMVVDLSGRDSDPIVVDLATMKKLRPSKLAPEELSIPSGEADSLPAVLLKRAIPARFMPRGKVAPLPGELPVLPPKPSRPALPARPVPELLAPPILPAEEPERVAEQQEPQLEEPEPSPASELPEEASPSPREEPAEEPERVAGQQEPQLEEPEPSPASELPEEASPSPREEPAEEPERVAGQQEPQLEEPEPSPASELPEEASPSPREEPAEEPERVAEQQEPQLEELEPSPASELPEEASPSPREEPAEEPERVAGQQEPQLEEPEPLQPVGEAVEVPEAPSLEEVLRRARQAQAEERDVQAEEPPVVELEGAAEELEQQALAAELGLPETAPAAELPRGLRTLRAIMQKAPPEAKPAQSIRPLEIESKPAPRSGPRAWLPF